MSDRMLKVNQLLHKEIASIVENNIEILDVLVTITRVDCAPDLKSAKVYTSILPDNKVGSVIEKLRKQSGYIRSKLAKNVRLRSIPALRFTVDDTQKRAAILDDVFAEINNEQTHE